MTPIGAGMKVLGYFAGKRSARAEMEFDLYCAHIAGGASDQKAEKWASESFDYWIASRDVDEIALLREEADSFDPADGGG